MRHNRARHDPYARLSKEEQNIVNIFLAESSHNMYRQWGANGKNPY